MKFVQIRPKSLYGWWLSILCLGLLLGQAGCALPLLAVPITPTDTPASLQTSTPSVVIPTTRSQASVVSISSSLSATQTPSTTSLPGTPTDTPTISLTPTITQTPTITLTPSRTLWRWSTFTPVPTRTPTITPTPTPPLAYLRILRPGAFSRLLSPIQIEASISPGDDGLVLIQLLGEDGRTLASQRLDYRQFLNESIAIAPKFDFKIEGVSELGRLVVSVDDKYGRKIALTSTDLLLFSIGDNDAAPAGIGMAPYLFRLPVADQIIQGGVLAIRGLVRPVNDRPVILELLDEQGQVLTRAELNIPLPSGNLSHNPFSIDLAYKVNAPMHARLVIRQESANRIPGTVALWSVPINLEP